MNRALLRPRIIDIGSEGEPIDLSRYKVNAKNGHIYSKLHKHDPREIVWRLLSYCLMMILHLPAMQAIPSSSTATRRQTNKAPLFNHYEKLLSLHSDARTFPPRLRLVQITWHFPMLRRVVLQMPLIPEKSSTTQSLHPPREHRCRTSTNILYKL